MQVSIPLKDHVDCQSNVLENLCELKLTSLLCTSDAYIQLLACFTGAVALCRSYIWKDNRPKAFVCLSCYEIEIMLPAKCAN